MQRIRLRFVIVRRTPVKGVFSLYAKDLRDACIPGDFGERLSSRELWI